MRVDPALLREWSKTVAAASDDIDAVDVYTVFGAAATACTGTALVRGLSTHACTEGITVAEYRDSLDILSQAIRSTADELENADYANASGIDPRQYR
ncbi:hypothetical protein [Williamsia sp. 1135]|uniref:hypothetical protein n=1 Tax=Williamsia sp. 1135 TaxID=1889262 RepID=UPI000A0F565E|nr:hypothetical protein [Williamsia sp. 1135]ORM37967.1 hypothetical protein BFL43_01975 [Williamsia sp. 1135]